MPWNDPALVEGIDRPIVGVGNEYPSAFELDWHRHRRGQLLYAARGVVVVSTRSVLIEPGAHGYRGDRNMVIQVSPLLRSLMEAACDIAPEYEVDGRDGKVMALLLAEIACAPMVPLAVPFPQTVEVARKCQAFLEHPTPHDTIDRWSADLGIGRRAFTRLFKKETGLSFGAWRQQACILVALPRLAKGEAVTTIAFDLGYESAAAFTTMFKRRIGVAPSHYRLGGGLGAA